MISKFLWHQSFIWQKSLIGVMVAMIRCYRYCLSPYIGYGCRFFPSCSCYAEEALRRHGVIKGGYLMFCRLLRCHPWCAGGIDVVP